MKLSVINVQNYSTDVSDAILKPARVATIWKVMFLNLKAVNVFRMNSVCLIVYSKRHLYLEIILKIINNYKNKIFNFKGAFHINK